MTLRALFAWCGLALAGLASAADYDLVVPRGLDFLKNAKAIVVYSPTGAFQPGDHITRVIAGGADGPGVRVSAGWSNSVGTELAKAGSVNGFSGSIILSTDGTGANGLAATLVPAGQGATRAPDDNIAHTFPWVYVLVAGGVIVAVGVIGTLLRRGPTPAAAPIRFTGRKGIEEGVREIRSKIEEIQEEQKRLVRKPPVLRSFRRQIDGFDHRLREIEATNSQTHDQLAAVAASLSKLDERLNNIAQAAVNGASDSKKAIDLFGKLSAEQTKASAGLDEKIQKVAGGQDNLSKRLDTIAAQGQAQDAKLQAANNAIDAARKDLATRFDALTALNQAQDTKIQATNAAMESRFKGNADLVDAARKQIEKLDTRLSANAEGAAATQQSLKDLSATLASADKRLAGLEAQAQASAVRDEEAKKNASEIAKAAAGLEQELSQLDTRVEGLAKTTESLHINLQKSAEALQLNLQEISGRVSNTEGSLHANLQGLANELGTLRNEVGTLPSAMNSLGERVGVLDARLTPITERGDKLAEGVLGLQSRFDDAAQSLAKQVEALEARLETVQSEGSKLANLPEVLHGNAAELTAHVRSAETGLKSLGEELAKLQEAMLSGNKQSDGLADELAQRLEAWESSLANVASKVEDLKATEEEAVVERTSKKAQRAARQAASREAAQKRAAEEAAAKLAEEEAKKLAEKEAQKQAAEEARKLAAEAPAPAIAAAPPILTLVENEQVVEAEAVAPPELSVEETVAEVEETPEPIVEEVAAPAAEVNAPGIPDVDFDEEEADQTGSVVLGRSKAGRWTEMAGSSERLWSVKMQSNKPLPAIKGPIRPLTPIETPGVDHVVGSLICTGQGVAYVHGNSLQSFWPGTETKSVALQSPVPEDLWRLMMFGGYIYCAEERQVEIINTGSWSRQASFQGDYLNQAHTDNHWIGLMAWGDKLAVDFRDIIGNHINSPRELDASANEQCYFAASGNSGFVGTRSGSIFRVDPTGAVQLARPSDEDKLLSISVTKVGILAMVLGEGGVEARLISKDGHLLKSSALGCQVMAHAPAIVGDRFYIFDDCQSELITVSLKTLQVTNRANIESTLGVNRVIGLSCGKNHLLAVLGTDDKGHCTRAFVLDVKSGDEMTLCPINHPRAEMVAGDGHLVVATSSAYQNTLQVFNPFEAVELKSKKVA